MIKQILACNKCNAEVKDGYEIDGCINTIEQGEVDSLKCGDDEEKYHYCAACLRDILFPGTRRLGIPRFDKSGVETNAEL